MDIHKVNKMMFKAHYHNDEYSLDYSFTREELIRLIEEIRPGISKEIFRRYD